MSGFRGVIVVAVTVSANGDVVRHDIEENYGYRIGSLLPVRIARHPCITLLLCYVCYFPSLCNIGQIQIRYDGT